MAALFEPVSDPAPYPAAAKGPADENKGLSRRLRAGGTDPPLRPLLPRDRRLQRCEGCDGGSFHYLSWQNSYCLRKIGTEAGCNLEDIRTPVRGQGL
jgi:hypothetical protein